MTENSLEHLDLGPTDANDDHNLSDYFVSFSDFNLLMAKERLFVVGVKGSGKSAIKKYIFENRKNSGDYVIVLDDSYSFPIDSLKQTSSAGLMIKIKRYLNRVIVQWLINNGDLNPSDKKGLKKLLVSDPIIKRILKLSKIKTPYHETEGLDQIFFGDSQEIQLNDEGFYSEVSKILKSKDLWILVDDIGQIFTSSDKKISLSFIEGLIYAVSDLVIQKYKKLVYIVLFIRSEVFDKLEPIATELDKENKYFWHINWKDDELVDFLSERIIWNIRKNNEVVDNISDDFSCWEIYFDISDNNDLKKIQNVIAEYIVSGPRDLINLIDYAKDNAITSGSVRISFENLSNIDFVYGKEKLKQIARNYIHIYPELQRVVEYLFQDTMIFHNNLTLHKDINNRLLISDYDSPGWVNSCTPKRLIYILYKIGIIGYIDSKTNQPVFVREISEPDEALYLANEMKVHRAFHSYFHLK